MSLKLNRNSEGLFTLEYDHVVSIWNLLKYLVETPYLQYYHIKKYDGGNTLVPREVWTTEGVMFRELADGTMVFPYDSIAFILDDSIHNLHMVVSSQFDRTPDSSLFTLEIRETDIAVLTIREELVPVAVALYILSRAKLVFDKKMLDQLTQLFKNTPLNRPLSFEYIDGSHTFDLKGSSFIIGINDSQNTAYYLLLASKAGFSKTQLKEEEIKNLGFYRKKIMDRLSKRNKILILVLYVVIFLLLLLLLAAYKFKLAILGLVLFIVIRSAYALIKKYYYRIAPGRKSGEK